MIRIFNEQGQFEKQFDSQKELEKYMIQDLKELLVFDGLDDIKNLESFYQEVKACKIIKE